MVTRRATRNTHNVKVPPLSLVGKGTRHHSALAAFRDMVGLMP